jgi:cellulose biosynthesis protein BcsQ
MELRRKALQAALQGSAPAVFPATQRTTVSFFSAAGGTGRTTVLATLARLLSSTGDRILLVDGDADSLLPYYFGASSIRSASRRFAVRRVPGSGPIHVLSGASRGDSGGWFARELSRLRAEVDRVLVDVWPGMSAGFEGLLAASGTCVALLVPDLASVAGIQRVVRQLGEFQKTLGHAPALRFLLNKYDEQSRLHRATREWLREQLGDRLLPFALRESEQVSEALAEGTTVVDYAPSSQVVADFENLAAWVESNPNRPGRHSHDWSGGNSHSAE